MTLPGKFMAYVALGSVNESLIGIMEECHEQFGGRHARTSPLLSDREFCELVSGQPKLRDHPPEVVLASFHGFLERLLLRGLERLVSQGDHGSPTALCYAGGCALNILWNSALRSSGLFGSIWVPPFANDTGSALGAACCEMCRVDGYRALEWNVYFGPELESNLPGASWSSRPCTLEELGHFLHQSGEAVVFLHGRSELGPRALGHRSVIATPTRADTKDRLNRMKQRESYRPVAPMCLSSRVREVFEPGHADEYMLYSQRVRPEWRTRIPAVVHLDGCARVQTVDGTRPELERLLVAHEEASGVPVLCNTSANLPGCGFFPDAASAANWEACRYVWCQGTLHQRIREER